jgi:hypothetical protein
VIVAVGIFTVIIGASYKLMVGGKRVYNAGVVGMDLNLEAQKALINIGKDVRGSNLILSPPPLPVSRKLKEGDVDISNFQTLKLLVQEPDFSTIPTGKFHLSHNDRVIEYRLEKNKDEKSYRLMKFLDNSQDGIVVAKRIKFGYFKREPSERIIGGGSSPKIEYGTGPSVVQVYLEFEGSKIGKKSEHGYVVKYKTAFKLRGNGIN